MFWTIEDLNAGLCGVNDLGKPKPAAEQPPVVVIDFDVASVSLRERLRDDALKAYHALGGWEYLMRKPELLDKILAKIALPEITPPAKEQEWPAWLTARRLAYQESNRVAEDIAIQAPRRALANAPSAAPVEVRGEVDPEPIAPPTGSPLDKPSRGSSSE